MIKRILATALLFTIPGFAQHTSQPSSGVQKEVVQQDFKDDQICTFTGRFGASLGRFVFQNPPKKSFVENTKKVRTDFDKIESKYGDETSTVTYPVNITSTGNNTYSVEVRKVYTSYPRPYLPNEPGAEKPIVKDQGAAFKGKISGRGCSWVMSETGSFTMGIRKLLTEAGKI